MSHSAEEAVASKIRDLVTELREILSRKETEAVVGWCMTEAQRHAITDGSGTKLHSPQRQLSFALSVLLGTPEPDQGRTVETEEWDTILVQLNEIYSAYNALFFPATPDDLRAASPEWSRAREVALPAFGHFYFSGLLASAEQVRTRVMEYVSPFDSTLHGLWGITATQSIQVADWIVRVLERALEDATARAASERTARLAVVESLAEDIERAREQVQQSGYLHMAEALRTAVSRLGKVRLDEMRGEFGEVGERFWDRFSIARGAGEELEYPTQRGVAEIRPLTRIGNAEAMCLIGNNLYCAVLQAAEDALLASDIRERFLEARDRVLERQVAVQMRRLLGASAAVFESVSEEPTGKYEHDTVAVVGDSVFVIESKASPRTTPFRDPNKAFVRILRAFRSDKGIQKGFDQGMRVWRRLAAGESVPLFGADGKLAVELSAKRVRHCYCICVTLDDFGPLATNLSLLLEKDAGEPYPLAVNILDLETLGDTWEYLGWGAREFRQYIDERRSLHGRVFSYDEMEIAGFFVHFGSLRQLNRTDDALLMMDPSFSDFFDELYLHRYQGGPAPKRRRTQPFISDLRASLAAGRPISLDPDDHETMSHAAVAEDPDPWCECGIGVRRSMCCGRSK
jgi:hypothetical protein